MKIFRCPVSVIAIVCASTAHAQETDPSVATETASTSPSKSDEISAMDTLPIEPNTIATANPLVETPESVPQPIIIPQDTPIHLMVLREVSTKEHGVGHRFRLRVNKPVVMDGETIIPIGAIAWGEVTSAERSGNLGKSGKLSAKLLYVEVGDTNISISGETSDKGNSGTAETVMGVIGLGVFGLFAKGNNAKLKAGELMTAFTLEDTVLPQGKVE